MEQSAPRASAYKFIPQPIEQQLARHELGELLDVYQWGWRRGPKGDRNANRLTTKLIAFLIALGGTAATLVSFVAFINARTTTYLPTILLGIPIVCALIAIMGFTLLFQTSFCICAFSKGFVYVKRNRVTVLPWSEIVSCEWKTKQNPFLPPTHPASDLYTIRVRNG